MTKIDAKRCYPANADGSVRKNNSFKGSILFLIGVSLMLSPAFAQAQEFDIDAGPAVIALSEFAAQADVSVVYSYDAVDGLETNRVEGVYEPNQALNLLLAGTSLSAYEGDGGAFAISVREERGDSESKNSSVMPALMAQNTPQTTSTETSSGSDDGGTSIVTGKVTDARTGANLKGAKVTIEETGQWTSTNDLGEFRLVKVPTGSATLTVSYLGYAGQSVAIDVREGSIAQDFALRGGSEMDEIVVLGQRSARAIALNLERTAENSSTVLSADLLGQFNGTTISDSLRRAGGVAFIPDANTGEGQNILVRGLRPDLNQVLFNGVRLPDSSGFGRSASLNNILTASIESVTIHKTLLANHDSSGTGGLVEIETKSPLDRPRRSAQLGIEHTDRGKGFGSDLLATALVSASFGESKDFGASLSVQYRELDTNQINYTWSGSAFASYLPAGISSVDQLDPRTERFPFEPGVDDAYPTAAFVREDTNSSKNLTVTASLHKQLSDHTDLRLDFSRASNKTDTFSFSSAVGTFSGYQLLPVEELGGEQRYALVAEDFFAPAFPGLLGVLNHSLSVTPNREDRTTTISFRGETDLETWSFKYGAGYADGVNRAPSNYTTRTSSTLPFPAGLNIPLDFLTPEVANNTVDGRVVSVFPRVVPGSRNSVALPGFTEEGFNFYNDPNSFRLSGGRLGGFEGQNKRWTANISVQKEFAGDFLKYLEVGLDFDDARFTSIVNDRTLLIDQVAGNLTDLGLDLRPDSLSRVDVSGSGFSVFTVDGIERLMSQIESSSVGSGSFLTIGEIIGDSRLRETYTDEREIASFVQGRVDFGKLELIGGARVSVIDVESAFFSSPTFTDENGESDPSYFDRFAQIVIGKTSRTDVLPRVLANYRFSENAVIRGGYYSTVARPQIRQLSTNQRVSLDLEPSHGPNGDQPRLDVTQGNPALKPSFTHNFDLSVEWYSRDIGVIKAATFYKYIDNPIEFNFRQGGQELLPEDLDIPDTPEFNNLPDNLFVNVSQPINNENAAKAWGAEFSVERQFTFLPGFWSGFGVYANYTYTDSSSTRLVSFAGAPDGQVELKTPLTTQSPHTGTVALTYSDRNVDANLAYTFQDRSLLSFRPYGLSFYNESIDSLDFRLDYTPDLFDRNIRFYFVASDLLKGSNDPLIASSNGGEGGTPKYFNGGRWFGGRHFTIGAAASF